MFYPISQFFKSKGGDSSCKIDRIMAKTEIGMADLFFERHPPNFENQYNFWRCSTDDKMNFGFFIGFRFSKISLECSVHICSCPCIGRPTGQTKIMNGLGFRYAIRNVEVAVIWRVCVWFFAPIKFVKSLWDWYFLRNIITYFFKIEKTNRLYLALTSKIVMVSLDNHRIGLFVNQENNVKYVDCR